MSLQDWANLFNIFAAISLIVSAILLFLAMRENNRLARASNTESLVAMSAALYIPLMQDPKMAELYLQGATNDTDCDALSTVDQFRYRTMLTWWLIFHENVFYQWRHGLLDKHTYRPWKADLRQFIEHQRFLPCWGRMKHLFDEEFAKKVDSLLQECRFRQKDGQSQ